MNEETKQLFHAPWHVTNNKSGLFEIVDTSSFPNVATCYSEHDANRLARLPELYDAMMEAAGEYCPNIRNAEYPLEKCDDCGGEDCLATKWVELLRKVREGE